MSKYTPTPWVLCDIGDYSDFRNNSQVIVAHDRRIAAVHVTPGDAETMANARLIAAAPEMLVVLKTIRAHANGLLAETTKREMDRVIAKAECREDHKYNWTSTGPGGCDSHCIEHPCGWCHRETE